MRCWHRRLGHGVFNKFVLNQVNVCVYVGLMLKSIGENNVRARETSTCDLTIN